MSSNNDKSRPPNSNEATTNGESGKSSKDRKRSPSPNPFFNYISTSPQISPRSDSGSATSASPRSPRFQTEGFQHPNGMKIPVNGGGVSPGSIPNPMLTAGNSSSYSSHKIVQFSNKNPKMNKNKTFAYKLKDEFNSYSTDF